MSEDNYTDVSEYTPNWNPRTTGSNKNKDLVVLDPTPESWVEGYYIGCREAEINNKKYIIHKIKVIAVGNQAHLGAEIADGGTIFEFFGTAVSTNMIAENVAPGMCIKITWLGMQQPKKAGGQEYHGWRVQINNSVAPISVQNGVIVADSNSSGGEIAESGTQEGIKHDPAAKTGEQGAAPAAEAETFVAEGDDDLPF